jgi:tolkin protein
MLQRISEAINHWHNVTCIRFEIYSEIRHKNYKSKMIINYDPKINYCITDFPGYNRNFRIVYTTLGPLCLVGQVIHELGHIIGFYHEHSRVDRDDHVTINFNNISDELLEQYEIMDNPQTGYYGVQYDLFSIMHYGGDDKITPVDSKRSFLMGQRIALSFLDIKLASFAYKCAGI